MNWATNWSNCIWCGIPLKKKGGRAFRSIPAQVTREHIYPSVRGGWLVVPACGPCNSNRRDLTPYRFWVSSYLRQRRAWAAMTGHKLYRAPAAIIVKLYKRGRPPD